MSIQPDFPNSPNYNEGECRVTVPSRARRLTSFMLKRNTLPRVFLIPVRRLTKINAIIRSYVRLERDKT